MLEEFEALIFEILIGKNCYLHKGGYSQFQPILRQNLCLPHELPSDHPTDYVGERNLQQAPLDADSIAAELEQEHAIRQTLWEFLFLFVSLVRCMTPKPPSTAATRHRDQRVYGQRKFPQGRNKPVGLQRDRWVRPAVVAFQMGKRIWVGMRSRLCKCCVDQAWHASSPESFEVECKILA